MISIQRYAHLRLFEVFEFLGYSQWTIGYMTSLASNVMSLPTFKVLITNFDFSVFYRYFFWFSGLNIFVTFSLFVHQQTFYSLDKKMECKSLEQSTGCPRKKCPLKFHYDFL